MTEDMRHNLWVAWNRARGNDVEHPVDQIDDDNLIPEDLVSFRSHVAVWGHRP